MLPLLVRRTRQTPLRHANVLPDVLHQRFLGHVVVLWPYVPQYDERECRAVEILRKRMQDVDLDAALGILVVRIIPYAQHGGVHLHGLFAARGDWSAGGCGRGLLEVGNRMVGAALGDGRVVCCAGDADVGGERGDARVVERRVAVVDAGLEVVVSADAEAREGDVGGGDAEFFGAAAEALDDGAAQFEGEGRLHRCGGLATEGVVGMGVVEWRTVGPGDRVAGNVGAAHGCRDSLCGVWESIIEAWGCESRKLSRGESYRRCRWRASGNVG